LARKKLIALGLTVVIIVAVFGYWAKLTIDSKNKFAKFYFGVDVAYADLAKIKALLDQIADYTNFFVIGSTGVSHNQSDLNQTITYLVNHNLNYAIFTASATSLPSINETVSQYSDGFIGIYWAVIYTAIEITPESVWRAEYFSRYFVRGGITSTLIILLWGAVFRAWHTSRMGES